MGVLANRAVALGLLATTAFTAVASYSEPAEARNNNRAAAEQAEARRDKQRCDTMARDADIPQIQNNGQVFIETSDEGCIFKIVEDNDGNQGLRYVSHHDLSNTRENAKYTRAFDQAQKAQGAADKRAESQAIREAEKASREQNRLTDGIQRQVEGIFGSEVKRAISGAVRKYVPRF